MDANARPNAIPGMMAMPTDDDVMAEYYELLGEAPPAPAPAAAAPPPRLRQPADLSKSMATPEIDMNLLNSVSFSGRRGLIFGEGVT
jgi:hypothetical protein